MINMIRLKEAAAGRAQEHLMAPMPANRMKGVINTPASQLPPPYGTATTHPTIVHLQSTANSVATSSHPTTFSPPPPSPPRQCGIQALHSLARGSESRRGNLRQVGVNPGPRSVRAGGVPHASQARACGGDCPHDGFDPL